MQQHFTDISSDDEHPFEKNLWIGKGRKYPGCSVWVNKFLQQIPVSSLKISREDLNARESENKGF